MKERVKAWFRSPEGREKWAAERHKTRFFIGLGSVSGPGFREIAKWSGVQWSVKFEQWLSRELMLHYVGLRNANGTCGLPKIDAAIADGRWNPDGQATLNLSHWGLWWHLLVGRTYMRGLYTKAVDALFVHFGEG